MAGAGTPAAYIYSGQPGTSDAALYTAGAGVTANVQHIVAYAVTASTLTLSVHRTQSGAVETICTALAIPATSAVELVYDVNLALEGIVFEPGDSLHGSAGNATTVNVVAF